MTQNIFLSCRESIYNILIKFIGVKARVAELVDAPDLGSGSLGSEGSTPFARTIFNRLPVSNPSVSMTATECK